MHVKIVCALLLSLFALASSLSLSVGYAAEITACTLDKSTYYQGGSGYVNVTVYNDKGDNIRVTEASATINYFYADGTQYTQTFYTNATLPITVPVGQSAIVYVPFTLPADVAHGYGKINVRVKTDIWNSLTQRWVQSDSPTYELLIYIESPYKQQLQNLEMVNNNNVLMMYIFLATTVLFALMMLLTIISNRRPAGATAPSPSP
jgi:hypothetical protein